MALTREQRAELEQERAELRALQDRMARLVSLSPLAFGADEMAELEDAALQVHAWERVLSSGDGVVIVVTGGRDYQNRAAVFAALDRVHRDKRIRLLVQGGAPGADALAKAWAKERGVPCETEDAEWDNIERPGAVVRTRADGTKYDAAAGHVRNGVMLDKYRPHGVVAFPGHRGTADCCKQAEAGGVKVWRPYG